MEWHRLSRVTNPADISTIIQAIDDGASPIAGHAWREGDEDQIEIVFYDIGGRIIRMEYDRRTTVTVLHESDGDLSPS